MKTLAVLFIGLVTFGGISMASVAHASGNATLWFSPQTYTVQTGSTVQVVLTVSPNSESIDTVRANINFPAAMLEVVSFSLGSLFPYSSPGNGWNNTVGTLTEGAYEYGSPVITEGTFGTITFRALSAGTATISVADDSKLIYAGSEKINLASLGSATITISGGSVAPTTPAVTPTGSLEEQALVYFGAFYGFMPSASADWSALHCFAYGGCQGSPQDVAAEQAALVIFGAKYEKMPATTIEWNVIHTLAYTDFLTTGETPVAEVPVAEVPVVETPVVEVPAEVPATEKSLEEQALVYFGAFYGFMPSASADWSALHCFAYGGCQGSPQDVAAEQAALVIFGAKYEKMPATTIEWNVIHTLAYTDFLTTGETPVAEVPVAEVPVVETPVVEVPAEVPVTEKSLEEQALVYFGAFYGFMPSASADWSALHCFAYGGCQGSPQNIEAEQAALVIFGAKYEKMPATTIEWNVVHTLAYTDFLTTGETPSSASDSEGASEGTPAEEAVAELSPTEIAIGKFGALAGYLPSSDADWNAVDIMVNGYNGERDLEAETSAVATFVSAFGAVPASSNDWNIVAAIAYSGSL